MGRTLAVLGLASALLASACRKEPDCDLTTEEGAVATYARLADREVERSVLCARPVPEFQAALVGEQATEIGCDWRAVLFRCRVFGRKEASREVFAASGWKAATVGERERMALSWASQMTHAGRVLGSETPDFAQAGVPFAPPTPRILPDGGVRVTGWLSYPPGMSPTPLYERFEVVFGPDGAVVSDDTSESFSPPTP
jgi:hypothetical protein